MPVRKADDELVVYWDASAVVAALSRDRHHAEASRWYDLAGVHLLSSLAFAEAMAALARLERNDVLASVLAETARATLSREGPWRHTHSSPDWSKVTELATRWPLRGTDLWHLATAATLHDDLPTLQLLTFDSRMAEAADAIGLGARS